MPGSSGSDNSDDDYSGASSGGEPGHAGYETEPYPDSDQSASESVEPPLRRVVRKNPCECKVCYSVPRRFVSLLCGHSICRECFPRCGTTCPVCREPMPSVQDVKDNFQLNEVLENYRHRCKHEGCGKKFKYSKLGSHEGTCIHGPIRCPCSGCRWKAPPQVSSVIDHITEFHECVPSGSEDLHSEFGRGVSHEFRELWCSGELIISNLILMQTGGHSFVVGLQMNDGNKIAITAIRLGERLVGGDFIFVATVSDTEDKRKSWRYTTAIKSVREARLDRILDSGDCCLIDGSAVVRSSFPFHTDSYSIDIRIGIYQFESSSSSHPPPPDPADSDPTDSDPSGSRKKPRRA